MALFCFYGLRSYLPGAAFETRGWGRKGEKERERELYTLYPGQEVNWQAAHYYSHGVSCSIFRGSFGFQFFFISPFLLFNPFQGEKMIGEGLGAKRTF